MDAGNKKPRAFRCGVLSVWRLFAAYTPARPAPVGEVIRTTRRSEPALKAGASWISAAVVWRCSMGRRKARHFPACQAPATVLLLLQPQPWKRITIGTSPARPIRMRPTSPRMRARLSPAPADTMPDYRSRTSTHGRNMAGARALWRATGMKDGDFQKPIVAIANSFTQFVPGHVHLKDLGQLVAREIERVGGVAKEFNTIAVDDGIAMGHDGMLYSLPSRELIADAVE